MSWLYILVVILFAGGLLLIFGRDWVWKIDSRSEGHKRDKNGNPIRTEKWDRAHLIQGIVMLVVALGLGGLVYFWA
jgi:uncharacterized membrane protein